MGININDLNQKPLGGELLSGSESIMDNLRVLSEEELSISGGGGSCGGGSKGSKGGSKGSKGGSKGSKGGSKGGGCYNPCPPPCHP